MSEVKNEVKVKPTKRPAEVVAYFDYFDVDYLKKFLNSYGQIKQRKRTGLSQKQQAALALAVKRARFLGLIPYVSNYVDAGGGFSRGGGNRFGNRGGDGPTAPSSVRG